MPTGAHDYAFAQQLFSPDNTHALAARSRRYMSPVEFAVVQNAFAAGQEAWHSLLHLSSARDCRNFEEQLLGSVDKGEHGGITVALLTSFRTRLMLLEEWMSTQLHHSTSGMHTVTSM